MANRYILLPARGIRARDAASRSALLDIYGNAAFGTPKPYAAIAHRSMTVHDSTNEDGAKLVEMDAATAAEINRRGSPLRAEPEVVYGLPREQIDILVAPAAGGGAGALTSFNVRCESADGGAPLPNVVVAAFDNFAARSGQKGVTDAAGNVTLQLRGNRIDRLYVVPPKGYWGGYRGGIAAANVTVPLQPLDINYPDAIRSLYTTRRFSPALGVKVGVLDTGVGTHGEINLVGGLCTVTGEPPTAFDDIDEHGTHVSGLIGGRGQSGTGVLGLAPGVPIFAYRVFDRDPASGKPGASNYAIMKAMIRAQQHDIDVLNLSLGGGPRDRVVEEAITDARLNGMLVVVAAGNNGRQPVSYPAAYRGATAVSAMGRSNCFPAGSWDEADVSRPPDNAHDPDDFIAAFSNVGPQIACTGLGVAVLSTLPNNSFGPMSGTSMAAPMVAGCAASLLSQRPATYNMPRDQARSDAIEKLLQASCATRFNDPDYEGYGLPDPAKV